MQSNQPKENKFRINSQVFKYILIAACIILTLIMYMQKRTRKYYFEASRLPFYNIQVENVEDGTYRGKVYTSFMHFQIDFTVKDKKLTKIDIIENEGGYGKKVAPILDDMIAQNTSVVHAVKKEELASIVFVACVDDALSKGVPGYKAEENE